MFGDPITFTVDAVAKNLIRINQDKYSSEYLLKGSTSDWTARIRHSSYTDKTRGVKVDRHNVELVQTVFAVAPATTDTVRKAYLVFENDYNDPIGDADGMVVAFAAFMTAGNVTKLQNWES